MSIRIKGLPMTVYTKNYLKSANVKGMKMLTLVRDA